LDEIELIVHRSQSFDGTSMIKAKHQMDEYKATLQMVCSRLSDGAYQEILDEIERPFIEIKISTV